MAVNYSLPEAPFTLPPELIELKLHARSVVEKYLMPLESKFLSNKWLDEPNHGDWGGEGQVDGSLPREDWEALKQVSIDSGLYSISMPEEFGGGGWGMLGEVVVGEELKRSVIMLPQASPVGIPIAAAGTQEQKERFLKPSINGDSFIAFAQSEPGAGSDPGNSMKTTATRDGDGWRINGEKMWISGAEHADVLLVFAVTDPEKRQRGGITAFIVDAKSEGITTAPIETWLVRQAHQSSVWFDNVYVPGDRVLGEVGYGFGVGQEFLALGDRVSRAVLAAGRLTRGLEMATEWAKSRVTFGEPIANRQAIQWMLADVFFDLKSIRAIMYEVAARYDAGETVKELRHLASAAKYMGANYGHRSMDKIMQILGGMGETLELPVSTFYRELRHGRIGGGTDEMQQMLVARALLSQGTPVWEA